MKEIQVQIIELPQEEFKKLVPKVWYWKYVRGFVNEQGTIIINKDAKFIFAHSKEDLILHEVGHLLNYPHRLIGTMAWHGFFRL